MLVLLLAYFFVLGRDSRRRRGLERLCLRFEHVRRPPGVRIERGGEDVGSHDEQPRCEKVVVDSKWYKRICKALYRPTCPYI